MAKKLSSVHPDGPELVIGLVGALGSDLHLLNRNLEEALHAVGYSSRIVHLSTLLHEIDRWKGLPESPLDKRIGAHQSAGNDLRRITGRGDAMALLAIARIRMERERANGHPDKPISRCAYILRSLKHVEEMQTLRSIYGSGFFQIAAYSPHEARVRRLATQIAESRQSTRSESQRSTAEKLINRDQAEPDNLFGQDVRDTFPGSDAFFNANSPVELREGVIRFIEMLFGAPFHTPTRDEYSMFHARAAAFRSADLSRQVGAVVATVEGDVIAVGTNEVPKFGGGLYWAGDTPDARDFVLGSNKGNELKRGTLGEVLRHLRDRGWLKGELRRLPIEELVGRGIPLMAGTQLMNLGEFGRTVHAEMAALLDAARRGASVSGHTLYTTTFPCHNCAKHIVASGIKRVAYVEPYPKSLAAELHSDALVVDCVDEPKGKLRFDAFVGVAPRRYNDLFAMVGRTKEGRIAPWSGVDAMPRYPTARAHLSYLLNEKEAVHTLRNVMREKGLAARGGAGGVAVDRKTERRHGKTRRRP